MANFYLKDIMGKNITKKVVMPCGSTPRDFQNLIKLNDKILPTICRIKRLEGKPIYLSRYGEWDNYKVADYEECEFVVTPNGEYGVAIAISLAISVVVGVATYLLTPRPNLGLNQYDQNTSPTYDLTQQGNRVRINQPIPIHYGTIRAYPDIASAPFTVSVYPNQRFYKVALCVGHGYIEISDVKIDDTPISDFPWVETIVTIAEATPVPISGFEKPMIISKEVKSYLVDAIDTNYSPIQLKAAVLRATDEDINISSPGVLIDFALPLLNEEFLLFGQSNQSENGTYKFDTSTTPMTRLTSMDDESEFLNALVPVTGGTWAGDDFLQVNQISAVGVDPVSFEINTTGTTGDWFILNDATSVTDIKKIYFEFLCQQGLYTLGISITNKPNAAVSSPTNINILIAPVLIDGYVHSNPDIILLQNQGTQSENGLWVSNGAGVALTRHITMDNAGEFTNAVVKVNTGTYGGIRFIQTLTITTVDVDPVEFVTFDPNKTFYNKTVDISIHIQRIDNLEADVGPLIILSDIKINGATNQQVFTTIEHTLTTVGRYKAKVRRKYPASYLTDTNVMDKVEWISFRGEFDYTPLYTHQTFLVITVRASGRLNDSNIGIFNTLGERRLAVYDFGAMTWSNIQTNSPIWAFYDIVNNTVYGIGLNQDTITAGISDYIDMDNLEEISDSIAGLDIECNTRFDTSMSANEMMAQICQTMRCIKYERGGKFLLARDEIKSSINGFFSRENIKQGSLSIELIPKNQFSATWYKVTYYDSITSKKETVDCVIPSALSVADQYAEPFEEVEFHCVTSRLQAWKLGMHLAAQNRYINELIKFSTDGEGFFPNPFDFISLTHPMLTSTQSGYIQKVDGAIIYLSEPIIFNGYETGLISFKNLDGTCTPYYICKPCVNQYCVELVEFDTATENYTAFPFLSQEDEPLTEETTFTFGVTESSMTCIVKGITSDGENGATIEATNYAPIVHMFEKAIHLLPPLGNDYIVWPEFTVEPIDCLVNLATKTVTVRWTGGGFNSYNVRYLFNNLGVEQTTANNIVQGASPSTHTDILVYTGEPPSRVLVSPVIDVTLAPSVTQEVASMAKIVPIETI